MIIVCLYVLICICGVQGFVGCTSQPYRSQHFECLDGASKVSKCLLYLVAFHCIEY